MSPNLWKNAGRWTRRAHSVSLAPLGLVILTAAVTLSLTAQIFFDGLKAGLLTFGGAYTVIPFLHDSAVSGHHWLSSSQFVDGLALSGSLPAPLIIFSTFVGYLAGGLGGAITVTMGIFLPATGFRDCQEQVRADSGARGWQLCTASDACGLGHATIPAMSVPPHAGHPRTLARPWESRTP